MLCLWVRRVKWKSHETPKKKCEANRGHRWNRPNHSPKLNCSIVFQNNKFKWTAVDYSISYRGLGNKQDCQGQPEEALLIEEKERGYNEAWGKWDNNRENHISCRKRGDKTPTPHLFPTINNTILLKTEQKRAKNDKLYF